ncbi:elongation factor P--(R)-beta-lysine ligase [Thalassotalea ponticola]|uniref:elongation factor P--(R)-beta-lysine ligase n=1 Tax=Thalassotalea ponticola TaxID=1523392 RepID=UPI0025B34077|nr:elongation factor P--(R)-beta-lysine ligase [Thalassotalea ponticola]MDN3653712.1 elongation factor P--(R)-beta-lysine ligase [Thalassotalea ponticola]
MEHRWQPTANITTLKQRAKLIANIRQFFAERNVLEVETPCLSHATVTDVHLDAFATQLDGSAHNSNQAQQLFLQTSPEFAMKRLLAAGSGCIYQLCKAFRHELAGRYHNPEFTMLEWYRVGFDHVQLMAEVEQLMQTILGCESSEKITYQQVFIQCVGVDPLTSSIDQLKAQVTAHGLHADWVLKETDKDIILQFLFAELVETKIGQQRPCFVYHFPASQSALARIDDHDQRVARRFELYFKGFELANGFHELTDAQEQARRFEQDNQWRLANHLPIKPIDKLLIAALTHGLPDCAGVALGVDRLLMLALDKPSIDQVISFSINNA